MNIKDAIFMTICNICGNTKTFLDMNKRKNVRCAVCNSLERHRLIRWTLEYYEYLSEFNFGKNKVLHLAPEYCTHRYLKHLVGEGYVCSDLEPKKYPHASPLKLALPGGFDIFPENYFDLILHNHVLEHIPGNYQDHLQQFIRILRKNCRMIFTIPHVSTTKLSIQGGENLETDEERIKLHGQRDHYKSFGKDFFEWFEKNKHLGVFELIDIPPNIRRELKGNDPVYVFTKY